MVVQAWKPSSALKCVGITIVITTQYSKVHFFWFYFVDLLFDYCKHHLLLSYKYCLFWSSFIPLTTYAILCQEFFVTIFSASIKQNDLMWNFVVISCRLLLEVIIKRGISLLGIKFDHRIILLQKILSLLMDNSNRFLLATNLRTWTFTIACSLIFSALS